MEYALSNSTRRWHSKVFLIIQDQKKRSSGVTPLSRKQVEEKRRVVRKREEKGRSIFVKSFKVVDVAKSSARRIIKRW